MLKLDQKKIAEIMDDRRCPNQFNCLAAGHKRLCKTIDTGEEDQLVCLKDSQEMCSYAEPYGDSSLCRCPLRVFVSHEFRK